MKTQSLEEQSTKDFLETIKNTRKQAKRVGEYEIKGSEYIIDSGHYRYRTYFSRNQE